MESTRQDDALSAQILSTQLLDTLQESVGHVVPWFLKVMPPSYFRDTDPETRFLHLRALVASQGSAAPLALTLQNGDGTIWTYIGEDDRPGLLMELLDRLPRDRSLRSAKVHTALDSSLVLDVFNFADPVLFGANTPAQQAHQEAIITQAHPVDESRTKALVAFLNRCTMDYVMSVPVDRLLTHWMLFETVNGSDDVLVHHETTTDQADTLRITVAAGNVKPRRLFQRLSTHLSVCGLDIQQAFLDVLDDGDGGTVTLFGFIARARDGQPLTDIHQQQLLLDMRRLKWIDKRAMALAHTEGSLSLQQAEVLVALSDLTHQKLSRINPFTYARNRIRFRALRHLDAMGLLTALVVDRFSPESPLSDEDFTRRLNTLRMELTGREEGEDVQRMLATLVDATEAILRCNIGCSGRYALAMRLDPQFMTDEGRDKPFGIYFVHGRSFNGFHVRFRDIARGGVRVVRTNNQEQHAVECKRHYDEVHGLASAQQLKNKDIPEGGSKAVILLEPDAPVGRSVKGFGDAILDLLVADSPALTPTVDRLNRPEWLFLGPDENMTDPLILWLVARAHRRGYPMADAFMSSKPDTGVNHKVYGVTSEGLNVFLEVALKQVGIDPRQQRFTIKMTGGPDGDVAGNEIRILHREYGDNAVILGIADGSGSAEDPDGLNHGALLRLVETAAPIADFDPAQLGPRGRVTSLDDPQGASRRNTLHNRLLADAFLPCGGRPATIHGGNWQQFLTDEGKASAKVVVEGANLFITEEARQLLSENSELLIVKDSSANKAGVICSSYEIAASLLLDGPGFLAIKEPLVAEILDRLRKLAAAEAQLLFREYRRRSNQLLPKLSVRISHAINNATDVLAPLLENLQGEERQRLRALIDDHLPPTLLKAVSPAAIDALPPAYLQWTMASTLAARIIYQQGLDFLEGLEGAQLARLALDYLEQEGRIKGLIQQLEEGTLEDPEAVIQLLKQGGVRAGLEGRTHR